MLLLTSDGAGSALLGVSIDPTASALGMRGARRNRSQVNGRACESLGCRISIFISLGVQVLGADGPWVASEAKKLRFSKSFNPSKP